MAAYAVISDIHSNLTALDAALADIRRRQVDATFHLGDLVGYGPHPNEVIARIREAGILGVGGNYDSTVALDHGHCGCQYDDPRQQALSMDSYRWTADQVAPEHKRFLAGLPFRLDLRPLGGHKAGPTVTLIHGSPQLNTVYWREERPEEFCRKMISKLGSKPGDVVMFGHTHKPWARDVDGVLLINAGSTGRPKDGDPRGCYLLLTAGEDGIRHEFVRVDYDLDQEARAIADAGLPTEFATILRTGGSL